MDDLWYCMDLILKATKIAPLVWWVVKMICIFYDLDLWSTLDPVALSFCRRWPSDSLHMKLPSFDWVGKQSCLFAELAIFVAILVQNHQYVKIFFCQWWQGQHEQQKMIPAFLDYTDSNMPCKNARKSWLPMLGHIFAKSCRFQFQKICVCIIYHIGSYWYRPPILLFSLTNPRSFACHDSERRMSWRELGRPAPKLLLHSCFTKFTCKSGWLLLWFYHRFGWTFDVHPSPLFQDVPAFFPRKWHLSQLRVTSESSDPQFKQIPTLQFHR